MKIKTSFGDKISCPACEDVFSIKDGQLEAKKEIVDNKKEVKKEKIMGKIGEIKNIIKSENTSSKNLEYENAIENFWNPDGNTAWAGIILVIVALLGFFAGGTYFMHWTEYETIVDDVGLVNVQGVIQTDDGEPLENVEITLDGQNWTWNTNEQGRFYIYDVEGGIREITFNLENYEEQTQKIELEVGRINVVNAILEEGSCSNDCKYIDKTFEVDNPAEISLVLSIIIILFSVVTFYGSIAALRKSDFSMALIGSVAGILSYGFMLGSILSIVAMLMIFSDRDAFESVLNTRKENL
tara:strand:+ start:4736 stop:5626 length:891 start_codon:yes stop_codon:yes gene_type:complete